MKKILIASHDAGAANLISYWAAKNNYNYSFFLKGPSVKIFKENFPKLKIKKRLSSKDDYDYIITGTSLKSNTELYAINYFKNKVKTISFIDHWINYKKRFYRNNKYIYPDEIWVTDINALKLANKTFSKIDIKLKKNYYISYLKKYYSQINNSQKIYDYIYASNNFKKNSKNNPRIKISSKEIFIEFLKKYAKKNVKILLRAHPSENINKYLDLKKKYKNISFDKNLNILQSLAQSKTLVGCETMAIVVANKLGLKTINLDIGLKSIQKIPKKFINKTIKII